MSHLIHTIERSVEEHPQAGNSVMLLAVGAVTFLLFALPL